MTRIPMFTMMVCAALLAPLGTPAIAQTSGGQSATLTFSEAVHLPGVVLAAGTYVFERALSGVDGQVDVSTMRPKTRVAQLRTVSTRRNASGNAITFRPAAAGGSPAIAAWYVGKGKEGREFMYSTSELLALGTPIPQGAVAAAAK